MNSAVVIGATHPESPWLPDLLASADNPDWPVAVHYTRDWELSTIGWAAERYDEFIFLPQSSLVLDTSLFGLCFDRYAGIAVNLGTAQGGRFRMYLGKYLSETVREIGCPPVADKRGAVFHEGAWCGRYEQAEHRRGRLASVGGPMEHTDTFEERHGRLNMVVQNEYLRRYKSCWDDASVEREIERLARERQ